MQKRVCYIGYFEILDEVGNVAYQLAIPPKLSVVHNVSHIYIIRKHVHDLSQEVNYQILDIGCLQELVLWRNSTFYFGQKNTKVKDYRNSSCQDSISAYWNIWGYLGNRSRNKSQVSMLFA